MRPKQQYSRVMSTVLLLTVLAIVHTSVVQPGIDASHGAPPKIRSAVERKFRVPVGQKLFRLVCPVVAGEKEMLMIEWTKNGDQVEWDPRFKMSRENRELRMKNVRLEDSGRYECQATNGFGHKTIDFTVHVFDPDDSEVSVKDKLVLSNSTSSPNWLTDMDLEWRSPIQVNRGGRLELQCPARANPMPKIRWYKNNMLLTTDSPAHIASFIIDPTSVEDSGKYRCVVENRLGSIDAVFQVHVDNFFEEPNRIDDVQEDTSLEPMIDSPYNISVKVGHTAQFQCKAKASESPHIKWLKEVADPEATRRAEPNATIVSMNEMHLLVLEQQPQLETIIKDDMEHLYINKLIIQTVKEHNAGRYICVVTSSQGHIVYKSAQLNVIPAAGSSALSVPGEIFWCLVVVGVIAFICIVACAIIFLRRFQEPSSPKMSKPPPPPRIPPPMAPQSYTPSLNRSFNHEMSLDKTRSPILLHNAMFQQKTPMGVATLDRKNIHRAQRGYDEMSNVYDCGSPQPYWPHRPAAIYTPASGNYRTLEVGYPQRTHPSLYTEEYEEHEPFVTYRR